MFAQQWYDTGQGGALALFHEFLHMLHIASYHLWTDIESVGIYRTQGKTVTWQSSASFLLVFLQRM